jgi:hypothetical protein
MTCGGNNILANSRNLPREWRCAVNAPFDELEGFFDGPEDDPAKWLCMLKIYLDESLDDATGMYFVAGFMGNSSQWEDYVGAWKEARNPVPAIHLKAMRLASPKAPKRWGGLLAELAPIPMQCGLIPVTGSICRSDYGNRVAGTVLEVLMEGYVLAIIALMDGVASHLPPGERIQVFFEENIKHAVQRERAMTFWRKRHKTPSGWSVLASWGSVPKGILTEASDYLCYALQQFYIDPDSQKSKLTASILDNSIIGNHNGANQVNSWLDNIAAIRTQPVPKLTPQAKRILTQ